MERAWQRWRRGGWRNIQRGGLVAVAMCGALLAVPVASVNADPVLAPGALPPFAAYQMATYPEPESALPSDLPACLVGHWIHAHEEDTPATRVYRPADYPFPPSRGRTGFALLADGALIAYDIAPADGIVAAHGSWWFVPPNGIRMDLANFSSSSLTLDVVSCSDELLVIAAP